MNHTPGPWEVSASKEAPDRIIIGPNPHHIGKRMTLAEVYGFTEAENAEANARFIVRACNSHEQLLEALRFIAEQARVLPMLWEKSLASPERIHNKTCDTILLIAHSAIKAAGG